MRTTPKEATERGGSGIVDGTEGSRGWEARVVARWARVIDVTAEAVTHKDQPYGWMSDWEVWAARAALRPAPTGDSTAAGSVIAWIDGEGVTCSGYG